jgi:hypothetical protein
MPTLHFSAPSVPGPGRAAPFGLRLVFIISRFKTPDTP